MALAEATPFFCKSTMKLHNPPKRRQRRGGFVYHRYKQEA
jgi:hypothetical protein